jgi:hypothetical protein
MSDLAKWLGDGLKALAATPVSLFLAVFIVGLLVLYAPPVPGLGLEVVRSKAGPWVGLITVAAGVLFVVRTLAFVAYNGTKLGLAWWDSHAPRTTPSLRFTLNPHMASATWGQAKQRDESIVTQLMLDFFVHNHASKDMYLRAARLISPRVRLQDTLPGLLTLSDPHGGRIHSASHPILPGGEANGRVVLMVRRPLGRHGNFLRVVIGLTDQTGHEYRVTAKLWAMPTPDPTAQSKPSP